ncbi:hypothetical protein SCUCBS95973_001479 [Sporothrix curviconia]|uniref:Uncharacterized protein n=1 Tax=Sporothrix curviconia TaxID=1260050 RepID=A0ABP0AYZ4_9PEZI
MDSHGSDTWIMGQERDMEIGFMSQPTAEEKTAWLPHLESRDPFPWRFLDQLARFAHEQRRFPSSTNEDVSQFQKHSQYIPCL